MIEFVQTSIRTFWELLLPIPMPWQALIILMLFMPVFSWLFWRGVPWSLAKLSPVLFICVEFLAKCLLWLEYLLAQYMRKRNSQPLVGNYIFGDILGWMVNIVNEATQLFDKWHGFALTRRWIIRKVWYIVAMIMLPLMWFVSPAFGKKSTVFTVVNYSASWWCSLESWVMTGQWKTEREFCHYPGQPALANPTQKIRAYKFRREIKEHNKAVQSNPNNPKVYSNRGNLYLEQGYMSKAFKDYNQAIRIDPNFAPGHSGRGDVYLNRGDTKAAFKEYTHAITRDPNYAPGYKGRGDVYYRMGDKKAAFDQYQKAARLFRMQGETEKYQEVVHLLNSLR